MELLVNGRFTGECQTKTVELNGTPVPMMNAVLQTSEDRLPIVIWGERKIGFVKNAIASQQQVKVVLHLQARTQTFTNHEGETATVPYIQLKLFSFVGIPAVQMQVEQRSKDPEDNDPTGSFRCFTDKEKETIMVPTMALPKKLVEKVKPWTPNNGTQELETWGLPF